MKSLRIVMFSILFFTFNVGMSYAMPGGDYSQTCYNCQMNGGQLSCTCNDKHHQPNYTSLRVFGCPNVRNDNGNLRCLPPGKYFNTCHRCSIQANNMSCLCNNTNHIAQWSTISMISNCGDIENQNGQLVCNSGGYQGNVSSVPLPAGSYQSSCTSCRYDGFKLSCMCMTKNRWFHKTKIHHAEMCNGITNNNGNLLCH